ncbi:hypothetical protein [Archangium minus]|uniref:hypothetical protein n=1 Tax=Archangium TaxID=47 RepID=UPI0037BE292D
MGVDASAESSALTGSKRKRVWSLESSDLCVLRQSRSSSSGRPTRTRLSRARLSYS